MTDAERTYTMREVAELLRMSPRKVAELVATGELGSIRIGRAVRIPESAYRAFLEDRRGGTPER